MVLQAIVATIVPSAGKLLNTAFGWATVMLFGRVPPDRQIYLSLVRPHSARTDLPVPDAHIEARFPKAA